MQLNDQDRLKHKGYFQPPDLIAWFGVVLPDVIAWFLPDRASVQFIYW